MGKSLALLWNNFLLPQFFWLKMQKIHFLKKMELSVVFKTIEVYVVTNWSTRLEKHSYIRIAGRHSYL